jgi:glycosyltransferase involved in cell wall biosynthesis
MSAVDAISLAAIKQAKIRGSIIHFLAWRHVSRQRKAIEKKYFQMFNRITVVSKDDADFLMKFIRRDISVIPNGVDTEHFSPARLAANRKTVLFTGNLAAPMNEEACLYLLRDVFPHLHSKHPDISFGIAGRAPTDSIRAAMPYYVSLIADLPDLRIALGSAILCVSPIAYGTGIKNNVLQAMAMGIPVVATKLIAKPIGIKHGQTGIIAERGAGFVQAIEMLLANRVLLDRVGRAGCLHIQQNYSWQYVASCYMTIFTDIISEQAKKREVSC